MAKSHLVPVNRYKTGVLGLLRGLMLDLTPQEY
jgi:hypothetical protein